ncbi:MAG: TonB-dependent receptor [Turneriella sp.]|nr:TonB-dependent receptor [Turneriella sp.]
MRSRWLPIVLLFSNTNLLAQDPYDFSNLSEEEEGQQSTETPATPSKAKTIIQTSDVFAFFQTAGTTSVGTKTALTLLETPASVSKIPAVEIREHGYQSLNEVLYMQAGFFPAQGAERRTLGSRGFAEDWNNTHYLLLMDGIPINDNADGSAHTWWGFPMLAISSLEVGRGPGSALYGSNATNGVIGINTITGSELKGATEVQVRYGTYNTRIADFVSGNTTDKLQYTIAAMYFETDGRTDYFKYDDYKKSGRVDADGNPIAVRMFDARGALSLFGKIQGKDKYENTRLSYLYKRYRFDTVEGWGFQMPETPDYMLQEQSIISATYASPKTDKLQQEYSVRYQAYLQRYDFTAAVDGSYGGTYPDGAFEKLEYTMHDLFARAQWSYNLPWRANALLGVENTVFYYPGDRLHVANYDSSDPDYLPYVASQNPNISPTDENFTRPQPDFLGPIRNIPVFRTGVYAQFLSGELLSKKIQLTLGVRYDRFSAHYREQNEEGQEVKTPLVFQNVSPRAALVFLPTDNFSLKLLGGQAFRDPAAIELFSSNSWVAASNVKKLQPEVVRNAELIALYTSGQWTFSATAFYIDFRNYISYSAGAQNKLENLFSAQNAGGELEVSYAASNLRWFVSYSLAHRLREEVIAEDFIKADTLTQAPRHSARLGVLAQWRSLRGALRVTYHGSVERRPDEKEDEDYNRYRPDVVPAFWDVSLRAGYAITNALESGVEIRNALNSQQFMLAAKSAPSDYPRDGFHIMGYLRYRL